MCDVMKCNIPNQSGDNDSFTAALAWLYIFSLFLGLSLSVHHTKDFFYVVCSPLKPCAVCLKLCSENGRQDLGSWAMDRVCRHVSAVPLS